MAGGAKKKKKAVANTSRGFATTSIPSVKSKVVLDDADATKAPSTEGSGVVTPGAPQLTLTSATKAQDEAHGQRELHELTPEEMEVRLETSDLQQVVEQHTSKTRRDAVRQATRLQTDKRVLRGQAEFLSVKEWLPDELIAHILDFALSESQLDHNLTGEARLPGGDELLVKVWALRLCLLDLSIPSGRVDEAIAFLISNPPLLDSSSLIWGLNHALDWLSLYCAPSELDEYDFQRQKTVTSDKQDNDSGDAESDGDIRTSSKKKDSPLSMSEGTATPTDGELDLDVSDIESDLEPEELLTIYLETKKRLYNINPAMANQVARTKTRARSSKHDLLANASKGEKKLQQKLDRLQSDILFDQREADSRWASKKADIARDTAERKRLQLFQDSSGDPSKPTEAQRSNPQPDGVEAEAERLGQEVLDESESLDDSNLLGGMFDALPGVLEPTPATSDPASNQPVTIRDFGRLSGMSPRRILEDTCKARDPQCKLTYRLISPTTFACRHEVVISWKKDQDLIDNTFLPMIRVKSKHHSTSVTALGVAATDIAQSEAYVATVALFFLFSGSPKEERSHLKLPPSYRDLWVELADAKQEAAYAEDRESVRQLRSLIKHHMTPEDNDPEEVVFNASIRRRMVDGASGTSTPKTEPGTRTPVIVEDPQDIVRRWMQKTSSPAYRQMLHSRQSLPMFQFRTAALEAIGRHQVTILCGETGCGKSTQLPAFILEHELSEGRQCKIYCTEPRRISAISLAQRVSEELGERRGDVGTARSLVGYAIRLESKTGPETRLVYATVGIVLRMLENPDGIKDLTHLVIDEVHERSIDTDFLLIVLRSLLLKRPDLKVILMSATFDAQKFSNYLDGAPIITVPGRTFPVQTKFLEDAIELTGHTNDDAPSDAAGDDEGFTEAEGASKASAGDTLQGYSKLTRSTLAQYDEYRIDYSLVIKLIHKVAFDPNFEPFSKAVLVFLPGISEIRQLNDMLTGHPAFKNGWRIYPLHSSFSSEEQQAAFEIPPRGIRKIVLSTNIAETGVTIPDITCVIDTGKHKEMRFDERRQLSKLAMSFIARANAKQRRGRAGRVQEGLCFHLFTKSRHDELMAEQQTPEILRLSLQDLVMRVKICKLGDIEHALSQALDPPSAKNIRRAIDALIEVDALTSSEELTPLGSQLAKLPLDAQLGKLVLLGATFGCLDFALTVAATLTSKSPFLNPIHAKRQADTVRLGYKRGDSDLLTTYNAYCAWRKICTTPGSSEYQFCNKNFLSAQNLAAIEDLKAQLLSSLADGGFVNLGPNERAALAKVRPGSRQRNFVVIPDNYCRADNDDNVAASVVAWSFYPKILKQEGKGWRNIANNQSLALHPTSVNKHGLPTDVKMLSFYSIMQSSSRFTNAQETTPAPEMALVLLAGDAVFHMYAGVIVIDGNRLRYKVRDWKTMIVLKTLRTRLREVLARMLKSPGRELVGKHKAWMEVLERMFEHQRRA